MSRLLLNADVGRELDELYRVVDEAQRYSLGFPGASDLRVPPLNRWSAVLLNNIGDPADEGRVGYHTKRLERQVVAMVAHLLRAPATRWGYVTSGATEGNEYALWEARRAYPDLVAYASAAAHYSVGKTCAKLLIPLVPIAADDDGRMDLSDLAAQLGQRRDRAAIVVATAGTTMTEALDDVPGIAAALDHALIARRRLHVDAALSGIPLALLPADQRPAVDFSVLGVTSMAVSGHKFLSTLQPCGVLLYATGPHPMPNGVISYTGAADTTISGSRSGHMPLVLWYLLHAISLAEHAERASAARQVAADVEQQLRELGVDARRHPHAMTVYFPPLPRRILQKYGMPSDGRHAHFIAMPGRQEAVIKEFLADVRDALAEPDDAGKGRP